MSYSVYFSEDFDFVKGGKLPGLYGGASEDEAKSCSGGRQDNRGRCFSARMMWRKEGMGELYNYFPTDVQQGGGYCETAPMSHCDAKFGDSSMFLSFAFIRYVSSRRVAQGNMQQPMHMRMPYHSDRCK